MKLANIFRIFDPLPTIIILAVSLPFLVIGLNEARKAQLMVRNYNTVSGTVIDNDYMSRTDPQDISRIYWLYFPVVSFTTADGNLYIFTQGGGSDPPAYEVGEAVEVLYNPENPHDATISSWVNVWMVPMIFIAVGSLPILGLIGWSIWRYVRAERRFQAARQERLYYGP